MVPGFRMLTEELRAGGKFGQAVWINLRDEHRVPTHLQEEFQRAALEMSAGANPQEKLHKVCRNNENLQMALRPSNEKKEELPEEVAHYRTEDWLFEHGYMEASAFGTEGNIEIKPGYSRRGNAGPSIWCAFGKDETGTEILALEDANEICLRLGLDFREPGILRRVSVKLARETEVYIPTSPDAGCQPPFCPLPDGRWGRTRDLRDDGERYREFLRVWPGDEEGPTEAFSVGEFDVTGSREGYLENRTR